MTETRRWSATGRDRVGDVMYFGDPDSDGTWRIYADGEMLVAQYKVDGAWVLRGTLGAKSGIKASSWGFDAEDATDYLQAAIDSGADVITIDDVGTPWIVGPIRLRSNIELVFEEGVVVQGKSGEFLSTSSTATDNKLFRGWGVSNVTMRGAGTLRMLRSEFIGGAPYSASEHRHCLALYGCDNITISDLTFEEAGGDGIYIGAASEVGGCSNITITDVTSQNNYRQGMSVISCDGLSVTDSTFTGTSGTSPESGIDLEPNGPTNVLRNVVLTRVTCSDNDGAAITVALPNMSASSEAVSITIDDCTLDGALHIYSDNDDCVSGAVTVTDTDIANSTTAGLLVRAIPLSAGLTIAMSGGSIVDCAPDTSGEDEWTITTPIRFNERSNGYANDLAGVAFTDVQLKDQERNPMSHWRVAESTARLRGISGNLLIWNAGTETYDDTELTDVLLQSWMATYGDEA